MVLIGKYKINGQLHHFKIVVECWVSKSTLF